MGPVLRVVSASDFLMCSRNKRDCWPGRKRTVTDTP